MPVQPEPIALNIVGNAKAEAVAIEAALAKNEQTIEANKEVIKGLAAELKAATKTAQELAKAEASVKDEALKAAAAAAFDEAKKDAEGLAAALAHVKEQQKAAQTAGDKLKDSLKAATTEAKKLEREGAQAAAKALRDAKKEADDLQKKLEAGKAKEMADEVKRAATEAAELKKNFADVNSLAGRVAVSVQDAAVNAIQEFIRGIPAGNAAAERHAVVLHNLGGAYAQVQAATRGVVTAEQAYAVQARLSESGLSLNAQQLGTVTGRAREYAHTVGVDLQQALDQLTEGLNTGSNEQLRKFGIHVQQGATRTETFRSALRQLEEQQRGNAPAAISAAEAQQQFETALTQATHAAQSFIAEKVGLTDFLTQAASLFRDLADGTQSWADVLQTAAGTLGEMVGLRSRGTSGGSTSTSSDFMQQYVGAQQTARALGIDVSGLPAAGPLAVRTNPQERQRILDALNAQIRARQTQSRATTAAGAAGLFGGTDLTGVTDLSQGVRSGLAAQIGDIEHEATQRGASAALDALKAEARRLQGLRQTGARDAAAAATPVDQGAVADARAELARLQAQVLRSGGTVAGEVPGARYLDTSPDARLEELQKRAEDTARRAHENELAFLQRRQQATQAYLQALREQEAVTDRVRAKDREAEGVEAQRVANRLLRDEVERQHQEEALSQRIAFTGTTRAQIDADNALAEAEHRGGEATAERVRQLEELRGALRGLLEETSARIAQAEAEGRSQADINRLIQERVGLQSQLAQVSRETTQIQQDQHATTNALKDSLLGSLNSTTEAFVASSVAALESGKSWTDALEEQGRATLAALAKTAIYEGLKATAIGFVDLAQGNVPGATNAFIGAALWGTLGAASAIALAATAKPAAAAQTAAASSGAAPRPASLSTADRGGASAQPLQINISVSGALMTSEQVQDGIVRGLDHAHARGVIPRFLRPQN